MQTSKNHTVHPPFKIFLAQFPMLFIASFVFIGCDAVAPNSENTATRDVAPAPPQTQKNGAVIEERVKVGVGVTGKGTSYGGGAVSEPVSQYWSMKEKIAFDIVVKHSLNLYKAGDPKGKGPKSHEEFMDKIIKPARNFELPKLPEGHRYEYDPNAEQLMVVRPANSNK